MHYLALDDFDLDDLELALCEYFLRLEFLCEKLQREFDDAFTAWAEATAMGEAVQAEFDAIVKQATESVRIEQPAPGGIGRIELPMIYTPAAATAELKEESLFLQAESAAGSLVLILDDVIQRLRHAVSDEQTGQPRSAKFELGELLGGVTFLSTAIYAAGNAYRHSKDWKGLVGPDGVVNTTHRQYKLAKGSLRILEPVVGLPAVADENVCIATVAAISLRGENPRFAVLWDRLSDLGRAFAKQYCDEEGAFDRVLEALEYQRSYASVEVSFSGDERIYGDRQQ